MITRHEIIKVKDVFSGYEDKNWDGVVGYGGKLDSLFLWSFHLLYIFKEPPMYIFPFFKFFIIYAPAILFIAFNINSKLFGCF